MLSILKNPYFLNSFLDGLVCCLLAIVWPITAVGDGFSSSSLSFQVLTALSWALVLAIVFRFIKSNSDSAHLKLSRIGFLVGFGVMLILPIQ